MEDCLKEFCYALVYNTEKYLKEKLALVQDYKFTSVKPINIVRNVNPFKLLENASHCFNTTEALSMSELLYRFNAEKSNFRKDLVDTGFNLFSHYEEQIMQRVSENEFNWRTTMQNLGRNTADSTLSFIKDSDAKNDSGSLTQGTIKKQKGPLNKVKNAVATTTNLIDKDTPFLHFYNNTGIIKKIRNVMIYCMKEKHRPKPQLGYRIPFEWEDEDMLSSYNIQVIDVKPYDYVYNYFSKEEVKELKERVLKNIAGRNDFEFMKYSQQESASDITEISVKLDVLLENNLSETMLIEVLKKMGFQSKTNEDRDRDDNEIEREDWHRITEEENLRKLPLKGSLEIFTRVFVLGLKKLFADIERRDFNIGKDNPQVYKELLHLDHSRKLNGIKNIWINRRNSNFERQLVEGVYSVFCAYERQFTLFPFVKFVKALAENAADRFFHYLIDQNVDELNPEVIKKGIVMGEAYVKNDHKINNELISIDGFFKNIGLCAINADIIEYYYANKIPIADLQYRLQFPFDVSSQLPNKNVNDTYHYEYFNERKEENIKDLCHRVLAIKI